MVAAKFLHDLNFFSKFVIYSPSCISSFFEFQVYPTIVYFICMIIIHILFVFLSFMFILNPSSS